MFLPGHANIEKWLSQEVAHFHYSNCV